MKRLRSVLEMPPESYELNPYHGEFNHILTNRINVRARAVVLCHQTSLTPELPFSIDSQNHLLVMYPLKDSSTGSN